MSIEIILVLGCGFIKNGIVVGRLKNRLDLSISVYNKIVTTNPNVYFMVSGKGRHEEVESVAMKRYLISKGIQDKSIMEEGDSMNTIENVILSNKLLTGHLSEYRKHVPQSSITKIHVVTSTFHLERTQLIIERYISKELCDKFEYYGIVSVKDEDYIENEKKILINIKAHFDYYDNYG